MKFVKRLIILTGNTSKGTLTLEKNAFGIWLKLNTFNLTPSPNRELAVFSGEEVHIVRIDEGGKVACDLPLADPEVIHAAVFLGGRVEMYGTNSSVRMPIARVEEEYARKKFGGRNSVAKEAAPAPIEATPKATAAPVESTPGSEICPQRSVEDYFLDIIPTYKDDAIAEENYFEKETDFIFRQEENRILAESLSKSEDSEQASVVRSPSDSSDNEEDDGDKVISPDGNKKEGPINEPIHGGKAFYSEIREAESESNAPPEEGIESAVPFSPAAIGEEKETSTSMSAKEKEPEIAGQAISSHTSVGGAMESGNTASDSQATEKPLTDKEKCEEKPPLIPKNKQRPISIIFAKSDADGTERRERVQSDKGDKIKSLKPEAAKNGLDSVAKEEVAATSVLDLNLVKKRLGGESGEFRPRKASFYEKNKDGLDTLFSRHKRYETLEKLLPGSRWVKIDYDGGGRYYVVGVTEDYLCYGVPAIYSPSPPKELKGYCQWLPKNSLEPRGEGFWIIFQDLASGETLRFE